MKEMILALLPESTWPLILVVCGFIVMLGGRALELRVAGMIILMAIFLPVVDGLFNQLPDPIVWLLMAVAVFMLLRFILGRRVMENVLSSLVYDLIRAPFRALAWILFRRPNRR